MTDKQRFEELYITLGVDFKILHNRDTDHSEMRLEAEVTNLVTGYYGFCTSIYFDEDGSFLEQAIYE
jgi:hypothetical protein